MSTTMNDRATVLLRKKLAYFFLRCTVRMKTYPHHRCCKCIRTYVRTYMHANTDVCLHTHKGTHKNNTMITQPHAVYNDEVVVVVAYQDEWQR